MFRSCAELIDAGVDPNDLYRRLYQTFSHARFKLMVAMLNRLELHLDGRYASQYLVREDFERTGAAYRDTENLINECQRIGSVVVAALFMELRDGRIRCSLRSRPEGERAVDVSEIAAKFGGGGHKMAAGTYLPAHRARHAIDLRGSGQEARRASQKMRAGPDPHSPRRVVTDVFPGMEARFVRTELQTQRLVRAGLPVGCGFSEFSSLPSWRWGPRLCSPCCCIRPTDEQERL